jgi:3'(2'), 5'-bisphosphate nucleotidase
MLEIIQDRSYEIVELLLKVGDFVIEKQKENNYEKSIKDDKTIVTELDYASNIIITQGLNELFGQIEIVSEENDHIENIKASKSDFFFLLDPIDGTKSFDKGEDFTINLAFCSKNQVSKNQALFSIILEARKRSIFLTSGKNVIKYSNNRSEILKIKKDNNYLNNIKIITNSGTIQKKDFIQKLQNYLLERKYNIVTIAQAPAMTKLSYILEQSFDLMLINSPCKDWDIIPALPILDNFSIHYSNLEGSDIYVGQNNSFNQNFLAASHDAELINYVKEFCGNF